MTLLLASGSAARRALLDQAGITFAVRPASIDEAAVKTSARMQGADPSEAATLLAQMKAQRISAREPEAIVIAADQILVCGDRWFSKPADAPEALSHLRALRGRAHELVTAVTCQRDGVSLWRHVERPRLTMRMMSDAFLDEYVKREGEAILDCVGAYRLEGPGIQLFDRVEGDFFSVLGLPLLPLLGFLRQSGALPG